MGFHEALRKHNSTPFADLYKTNIPRRLNVPKTIEADRKLLQRLLNAVTSGRTIQMWDILKHELSHIPLSLAHPSGDMNTTTKAELIAVLTDGVDIPSEVLMRTRRHACSLMVTNSSSHLGSLLDVRRLETTQMFSCRMSHDIFESTQAGLMWYSIAALGKAQTRM